MAESAISRAARAMDLIPYVLENAGVKTGDLASKFGVTEKQIVKDLELIFMCGLPGYTPYELIDIAFADGIVSVIDPQVLDRPRKFSETEAVIINLGLILLQSASGNSETTEKLTSLISKLTGLFNSLKLVAIDVGARPAMFDQISDAINLGKGIRIKYLALSKDQVSIRNLLPSRIVNRNGFFYVQAQDIDLHSERVFRCDLISECEIFEYETTSQKQSPEGISVINFEIETVSKLLTERYKQIFSSITLKDGVYRAKGSISSGEWLHRWVLSNSPTVRVIEPQEIADQVLYRAREAMKNYL
jgi:predicted DNA-binding transcriptional regulator YafY